MSIVDELASLKGGISADQINITDHDAALALAGFEPDNIVTCAVLFGTNPDQVEQEMDAIYIAASAGNPYAKFLIHAAANIQAAYLPPNTELSKVTPEELASYEEDMAMRDRASDPLVGHDRFAALDGWIQDIDLIIEQAQA